MQKVEIFFNNILTASNIFEKFNLILGGDV